MKKYRFFMLTALVLAGVILLNRQLGIKALGIVGFSFKEMLMVIPPIFILLGLLDIWVPKETMVRYMGEDSGWLGVILAILLGSAAAGPLYGAFPIAAVFMKKGVRFTNVLIFIGAWSTTKIPMFLFEMASLGTSFALIRLAIDIPGIIFIAYILNFFVSKAEIEDIYKKAESL
ncbi:permease [Anaerosolibacter carboniphilus]|nr:permease [Anaerosolibacter carboniphilus]